MSKRKWKFSDIPGSKDRLKPHADEWIANALSTTRITRHAEIVERINGLYAAADLPPPRDVIFVPSPLVMARAAMLAAGVLYQRAQGIDERRLQSALRSALGLLAGPRHVEPTTDAATVAATFDATDAATIVATDDATDDAIRDATWAATDDATRNATDAATIVATDDATIAATAAATAAAIDDATSNATYAATDNATSNATYAATDAATYAATDNATSNATYAATDDPLVAWLLGCLGQWRRSRNGGNEWSAWCSYLSFGRVIGRTDIDYSKWIHYERLAQLAGPRIVMPTFAIISERPTVMRYEMRGGKAVLHATDGPAKQWADGWSVWFRDGVRERIGFEPTLPRAVITYRDGVRQPCRVDDRIAQQWAELARHDDTGDAERQMFLWLGEDWRNAA